MWSQPLSRLQFNLQAMHFLGFTLEDCRAQLSSSSTLILWWCVVWWWETTSELRNKLAPKKTPMDWLLHLPSWHNYRWVFGDLILEITRSQSVSWIAESPSCFNFGGDRNVLKRRSAHRTKTVGESYTRYWLLGGVHNTVWAVRPMFHFCPHTLIIQSFYGLIVFVVPAENGKYLYQPPSLFLCLWVTHL